MNESSKPKAPDEVMIVGYFLKESREALRTKTENYGGNYVARAFWYLTESVERLPAALDALRNDSPVRFQEMLPSKGMFHITRACQRLASYIGNGGDSMVLANIEYEIGSGHIELSKMMRHLRFQTITDEDLADIKDRYDLPGGGGGR